MNEKAKKNRKETLLLLVIVVEAEKEEEDEMKLKCFNLLMEINLNVPGLMPEKRDSKMRAQCYFAFIEFDLKISQLVSFVAHILVLFSFLLAHRF